MPINDDDDLSRDYTAGRTELQEASAAEEMLSRFGANSAQQKQQDAEGAPGEQKRPASPRAERAAQSQDDEGGAAAGIMKGIVQTPRALAHGAIEAVNEVVDLSKSFEDYMAEKFGTVDVANFEYISPEEIKQGKAPAGLPKLPNLPAPDSKIGQVVSGISQFLTGFFAAGKLKPFQAMKPASAAGQFAKASAQGAVADFSVFDPHEQRLSDLIQSFPQLQNPVTEYLAADPEDSEVEGRFKNALEGLGLGVITEAFMRGLKTLRKVAIAKREQADAARVAGGTEQVRPEIADDAFKDLGEVAPQADEALGPGYSKTPEPKPGEPGKAPGQDIATGVDNAVRDGDQTFINFARIDTPDDVKAVMQNMADAFKPDVDAARRGAKTTFKQMELDAQHVNAWETLKQRRVGEPLNAEQSIAARQLWATSADKLTEMAKKAAATGSEADLFAFRKMMATHQTIQAEVIAARTETARALASWRIPTGSGAERFMEIDNALMGNGGKEMARDMAQRVASLADNGMIMELDKFVEKSAWAKGRDAMLEAWINALLSGPKTHLVNMISNTSVLFQQMYERKTAAKIAEFLGDADSVAMGEATAQYAGMVNGYRDAVRYAAKSFKTGESGFGLNKVELPTANAISSEALGMSSQGFLGRSVDVLGSAINLPSRGLAAADEFFKTIGYRMELNAQALRKATQDLNAGLIEPDQLKQRIVEIIENPPADVRLASIDQATYQTFTKTPGDLAKLIQKAKGKYPGLNLILPFVRTPANIMNYTFERTPFAPLFKQFRADIAAGGARRDLALARMSTGSAIMLVAADMAMSDQITGKGPSSPAERNALLRTGWQPYSVKVGDRYYAYNRLDPLGMTLGLSADMVEILANDDYGVEKEKSMEELAVATSMAIANNAMSKTYLSGVSDLMNAMSDPERYGEGFFQRLAGSVVPTGVAEVTRMQDPYMREAQSMVEAMQKRTPGLSEGLPVRRNLWGEPVTYQSGLGVMYDAFSPIYSRSKKPSPIDEAILEHEMNINMPNKKMSIDGVSVNLEHYPGAYSRFVQLAGNEAKHIAYDNKGAKDFLNSVVSGESATYSHVYNMRSDGPDGGKYFYVREIIQDYRELAKRQLLKEFPEIKDEIEEKTTRKLELKMPTFGG